MIHVSCDMLLHWASGSQHFKEMECHLRIMISRTLKMKTVCLFRTNCQTMQCPYQKTGILNYATEKIWKLSAIYIVEQQSFQSLDNLINSTTWAGQGKNHLNSVNNGDSKSKQNDYNQSESSAHNMPSKHRQGIEVWLYSFISLGTEAGWLVNSSSLFTPRREAHYLMIIEIRGNLRVYKLF